MRVIFVEDVPNVASVGDVKKVADGYARNYLFPKKLAVLATDAELRRLEVRLQATSRRQAGEEQEAQAFAQTLEGLTVALKARAGTKGRIYGSITNAAIAKELKRLTGQTIDKHTIEIGEPIKVLGEHTVSVKLTRNVTATVNILVEPKEEAEKEVEAEKEEKAAQEQEQQEGE
jgi:large subunit ribosomal protein L9